MWFGRPTRGGDGATNVYLDEQLIGTLATLRRIPIYMVAQVRYMPATEAQVRFGTTNGLRAAILVDSARP